MRKLAVPVLLVLQAGFLFGGERWVTLTRADDQIGHNVIAADPFAADVLYADLNGGRNMTKSTDGGRTWRTLPFTSAGLRQIVVERSAPNRLTALSWDTQSRQGYRIHRSADSGMTWTSYEPSPIVGMGWDVAVDPVDSRTLYVAHVMACFTSCVTDSGGVSKSTDGGRSWTALFKGTSVDQVIVDPLGSGTIFAAGWAVTRRSENGGRTWTDMPSPSSGSPIFRMAFDPVVPGVVYASTSSGFWRSADRGTTWSSMGVSAIPFAAWTIAIDPTHQGVIVIGVGGSNGARRTTDGGKSWHELNEGLVIPEHAPQIATVQVVYASNGQLYAAATFIGAVMLNAPPNVRRQRAVRQ